MTTDTLLHIDADSIRAFSKQLNEPAWLTDTRLEALELAKQLDLPKVEKTKINRWKLESFGQYAQDQALQSLEDLPGEIKDLTNVAEGTNERNLIVQRNASIVYQELSEELKQQGVLFTDLHTAAKEHSDLVQKYFMTVVEKGENKLTALHAAIWSGGIFLYVPKNTEVKIPIQTLFVTDRAETVFSPHVLIVAEANSSVTYVSNYTSAGDQRELVHNGVVEVVAGPGARVQYAAVHNLSEAITDISYRRALVQNDASIDWVIGEMNNGNVLSDVSSILKGNGSRSYAKVVCIGEGKHELNVSTRAVHYGLNSDSDMLTRAVMRDEAQAIINGITKIEKGATGANGEQTERVLMLSPKARGDANPMLLIDEDEVTAGHAASAGQVDKDQIYYLMSRGISKQVAEKLIILGFLEPIVSEIPIKAVKEQLSALIERKLSL